MPSNIPSYAFHENGAMVVGLGARILELQVVESYPSLAEYEY